MVCYDFYRTAYRGNAIEAADWPHLERDASARLARYKRIYTVTTPGNCPDAEKMAVCAMAEALHDVELTANGEGGPVSSASIGSVSVGYGTAGAASVDCSPAGVQRSLLSAARLYLDIYRGAGRC